MPPIPTVIGFGTAAGMVAAHLKMSPQKTLDILIGACCDGAVECWGHDPGSMPKAISALRWNEFQYERRPLPFEIENIEVITITLLKWLLIDGDQISDVGNSSNVAIALSPTEPAIKADIALRGAVRSKRGPQAVVRDRVRRAMVEAQRNGLDLASMKEEAMKAQFGASRETCRKVRTELLSEIVEQKHRQTPTSDK